MSKLPTPTEHARLWAKMPFSERRRILRAVNRGEGLQARKDARIAVGVARQQQRYWRWAWLLGPPIGLLLIPDWVAVVVNAVIGTAVMSALAAFRYRRAQQAEVANLERLGLRRH